MSELRLRPHEWSGARDADERICVCRHGYDDHIYRGVRLVCDERACKCREFVCADHHVADVNGIRADCFEDER